MPLPTCLFLLGRAGRTFCFRSSSGANIHIHCIGLLPPVEEEVICAEVIVHRLLPSQ